MDNKTIKLPPIVTTNVRKTAIEKPKKTRVFVEEQKVLLQESDYDPEVQWHVMFGGVGDGAECAREHDDWMRTTISRHLAAKLQGYKTQDQTKAILDPENFVDVDYVIALLKTSEMRCYYCKDPVQLLYKHVREPKQWTLDRIDNDIGHNRGNVEIACLSCNLRRRCIYHERFLFTKQMRICKMGEGGV